MAGAAACEALTELDSVRSGATILAQLVGDARSLGYDNVRLDTGPFTVAAHRTYEVAGFVDRGPYQSAEVPKEPWTHGRFMELSLR